MIDLSKLTPATWGCVAGDDGYFNLMYGPRVIAHYVHRDECEFAALSRNALDVSMRRGWSAERFSMFGGGYLWRIPMGQANDMIRQHGADAAAFKSWASLAHFNDLFTALVEADKWYRNNVEKP